MSEERGADERGADERGADERGADERGAKKHTPSGALLLVPLTQGDKVAEYLKPETRK